MPDIPPHQERSLSSPERRASRAILLLALLWSLAVVFLAAVTWFAPSWRYSQPEKALALLIGLSAAAGLWFVARAVAKRAAWARKTGIALGLLLLAVFPIGTVFGGYILLELVMRWDGVPDEANQGSDA